VDQRLAEILAYRLGSGKEAGPADGSYFIFSLDDWTIRSRPHSAYTLEIVHVSCWRFPAALLYRSKCYLRLADAAFNVSLRPALFSGGGTSALP
jgi:hypothetical protein